MQEIRCKNMIEPLLYNECFEAVLPINPREDSQTSSQLHAWKMHDEEIRNNLLPMHAGLPIALMHGCAFAVIYNQY